MWTLFEKVKEEYSTTEIANVVKGMLAENMDIINGTVITINGGHK